MRGMLLGYSFEPSLIPVRLLQRLPVVSLQSCFDTSRFDTSLFIRGVNTRNS